MQSAVVDVAPRLPPVDAGQGPAARPRRRRCRGGTWSRRCRSRRADDRRGTRASTSSARAFGALQRRARRPRRPRPRRAVDRRRARATASAAARSACRSSATARSCCSTGRAASTRRRRRPTSSATPTTTRRWPTARRCSGGCRWRWPRRPASSARRSSSRPACARLEGAERLALLDVDLQGANQVVVDIHSRFLFETEVFARRQRRTLGVGELNEMMLQAQADAYGDGLDQSTAPPVHVGAQAALLRQRTSTTGRTRTGCCSGSGCSPGTSDDPERFRAGYDDAAVAGRHGHRRGARRRRSASTSPTRRSGPRAST